MTYKILHLENITDPTLAEELKTIISFDLPFIIPISDGIYETNTEKSSASVKTTEIRKGTVPDSRAQGLETEAMFDKYGFSGHTHIDVIFPYEMPKNNFTGRRVTLFITHIPSRPKNKNKELAINVVNRLIDVVRIINGKYYLRNINYSDIPSWKLYYWDGKKQIVGEEYETDYGIILIKATGISEEIAKGKNDTLEKIKSMLKNNDEIPIEQIFLANSKDACLEEDFRTATIESVVALEFVLYRFIIKKGFEIGINKEEFKKFIQDVGLTKNIKVVLKMLTVGLEQPDEEVISKCLGAITVRNKIMHIGLSDIPPSETEDRIINIEKMINYIYRVSK